jgi:hypothetical protein
VKKNMTTDELFAAYFLTLGMPASNDWASDSVQEHYKGFKALVLMTINSTGLPIETISNQNMQSLYSRFIQYVRTYESR